VILSGANFLFCLVQL